MTLEQRAIHLTRFLIQNDALQGFTHNLGKDGILTTEYMMELCDCPSPQFVISAAFRWMRSPEGFNYWQDIADRFAATFSVST